jgi:putative flippase GtrA
MRTIVKALLKRPGFRYLIVGAVVYVFELIVIIIAQHQGAGPVFAVGLSYVLGTLVSFLLQKLVTFGDKRMHHKILIPQAVAVALLVIFNFGFTLFVTKLLAAVLPAIVSRTLALLITTIWNFYLYKTRIFKPVGDVLVTLE